MLGNWCGYVGLPKNHPYHGKDYDDVDVDVHGGLTYAAECGGFVCHVSEGADELYWLGFDCGHYLDVIPGMSKELKKMGGTYRDIQWVTEETKRLAEQLAEK